ncbi:MAG: ATP synthase F1 subunit epsilon [Pelagibacteraceae bacterium TMED65]|nr:ATP synthase F1 subunit epsilon [Rickettsiales bacterium]OUU52586.1 MAG: ATP synthase F1 subunit epsilon [Pelagibacteraceae bacterium TMED65]|tara:strand:- start:12 stop:347 length:336 start_codon:yes stop_codon:yes gene_type:complete
MSFKLEIITPDQIAYNEEIDLVIMPGIEGDFGVLRNHMPFLTYLRIGQVYIYKSKKVIETFLVNTGIVEVTANNCILLTEDIVRSKDFKISDEYNDLDKLKSDVISKSYYS